MQFAIETYISVGPLKWGMTTQDVRSLLGVASRSSTNRFGNIVEFRDDLAQSCIFAKETGRLVEVAFSAGREVLFWRDLDLIATPSNVVIESLRSWDDSGLTGFGSVVFPRLGIALTGYDPVDEEIRAASAFAAGRWDHVITKMRPLGPLVANP